MSARLTFGILGVAGIARRQLMPAIRRSRNGSLAAVASRDVENARAAARAFEIPRAYGSYEALLDDPDVDAVYVPLPNALHREWTIRAAQAGKHVLCEKPLAADAAEAGEMLAACRTRGVLLMEAFMYRFHPRTQDVARLVRGGAIGEPRLVRATFTFPVTSPTNIRLSAGLAGGALMDVGCYGVNVCRLLLGEPERVSAEASYATTGVDETLAATLRFPSGALGLVDCSLAASAQQRYEVVAREGILRVPHAFRPDWGSAIVEIERDGEIETRSFPEVNQYVLMVEAFSEAVLSGLPAPLPPEDAVANMRVLDAVRDAARRSAG